MSNDKVSDYAPWYVVQTKPREEDRADSNLRSWNIETFNPKIRERRTHPYTGMPIEVIKPLFPRYIFAKFSLENSYHRVRFTRGVSDLVAFADGPAPVDDEIISIIRLRMGKDGFVKIGDPLYPGDQVVVKNSPLGNYVGIFEREVKDSDRVMILLQTVSAQVHICVGREFVKKASPLNDCI